jgi:hypothetical protein
MDRFWVWLESEAGPDDWHRVAMSWNWDHGDDVPTWICRQERCDRATALYLYWCAQPDYFVAFRGVREAVPQFNRCGFDFVREVRTRWQAGAYVRAELGFELEELRRPDYATLEAEFGDRVATELPLDMRGPLRGRVLELETTIDGIPRRFWPEELL